MMRELGRRIGLCITLAGLLPLVGSARSVHRHALQLPSIEVFWTDDPSSERYRLTNGCLETWAIFGRYNHDYLFSHQLPNVVSYRNHPEQSVSRTELEAALERFVAELFQSKSKGHARFSEVKVLKDADWNYAKACGIIIVKFKAYPFVLKLARETPWTFVRPFSKGIVPTFFFAMGGGINRYLSNFTRGMNRDAIEEIVQQNEKWRDKVSMPRKWFWVPKDVRWFTIVGRNFGPEPISISLPSINGFVCDEIVKEREFSIWNRQDRETALELSKLFKNRLDSHICNFLIEKETGKITFIDTEHFASITGLKEYVDFTSYTDWYSKLARNCLKNALFITPRSRMERANIVPTTLVIELEKTERMTISVA